MLDDAKTNLRTESRPPVVLIAGPTASGKSALALAVAEARAGTIINADASQVYADLAILSARPDAREMARAPHRLFGTIDGAFACSAAHWAADAAREIDAAHAAGRLPILVGGTGLYIRTLLDGIAPIPEIDPAIRAEVRAASREQVRAALVREDPETALRLAPADIARASRALEVIRSTGISINLWRERREGEIADRIALSPLILLPPRDWLYARCDRRFETMLESGAIQEVERLAARKLSPDLPVMRAIGVPEILAWQAGEIDRDTMIERASAATRQYAKRQYTWFRRQPPADWRRHETIIDDKNIENIVTLFQH